MPTAFDLAFAVVVGEEGGYVNNPADPGGETKYGISAGRTPRSTLPP
jgi:lysozyme family protein